MDVIGCHHVIQDYQPVSFLRRKKPLQPTMPVFNILEQERPLMASVGNMPNMPWDVMSMRSCHWTPSISPILVPEKTILPYKRGWFLSYIPSFLIVILVRPNAVGLLQCCYPMLFSYRAYGVEKEIEYPPYPPLLSTHSRLFIKQGDGLV